MDDAVFRNEQAERQLLGAIMLDNSALDQAGIVSEEDLYFPKNRTILRAMRALDRNKNPIDLISVFDQIKVNGGGVSQIDVAVLTDGVPSAANIDYYIGQIKDCSMRRQAFTKAKELEAEIRDRSIPASEIISVKNSDIQGILDNSGANEYRSTKTFVPEFIDRLQALCAAPGTMDGIKTGFENIDKIIIGLQPTDFVVLGARPSIGKTALQLNIMLNMALEAGIPTGMFSIEMSQKSLTSRMVSSSTGIWASKLRSGFLSAGDLDRISDFTARLYAANLFIDDTSGISIDQLKIRARRMVKRDGVRVIFIDHFSLIRSSDTRKQRWEVFAQISQDLKALAKELKTPIVLLCQLKRDSEGKEPGLADLRESGSLEQDADIVMLMHRKRQVDLEDTCKEIPTDVLVSKNREGAGGRSHLIFKTETVRFVDDLGEKRP
jgi:replicative DNA helicase